MLCSTVPALLITLLLAQPSNPYLDDARRLVRELKFGEALQQLKVAREVPGLSRPQVVEVLELSARCHVAEGRRNQAEAAYTELLTLAPSFLPEASLSPKILETFSAAKARLYPRDYVKLVRESSAPGRVQVRLIDPWNRSARVLAWVGSDDDSPMPVATNVEQDLVSFEVDSAPRITLRWVVESRDTAGGTLASTDGEVAPLVVPVTTAVVPEAALISPEPETPRTSRVVPWVATAVAIAAVATGAALQLHSQELVRDQSRWVDDARLQRNQARLEAQASIGVFTAAGAAAAIAVVTFAW